MNGYCKQPQVFVAGQGHAARLAQSVDLTRHALFPSARRHGFWSGIPMC
uniref:Uncharacterized protein n=1 Tax=Rhizobium rhizogenes TaxID=359 RepID=A0A7S4ZT25_RHIRH|nr:hypothetical protein pC5.8b_246 [Rhizobium rhizogenes]